MHIAYSWIFFYLVWKFLFLTGTFSPFVLNLIVNIFEFIYVFSATTKYQTGWLLNNRHFFLTILVAGKSKTKVLADLVPGESLCSGLTMFAFSLCLHMAERVGSGLSSSFCMCACPVAQSCLTLCKWSLTEPNTPTAGTTEPIGAPLRATNPPHPPQPPSTHKLSREIKKTATQTLHAPESLPG